MSPVASAHAGHFAHPHRNVVALGIEPGMKVADFGAGSGAYTLSIAEHLGGSGVVYAVDIQKDLLRRLKKEATRLGLHGVEIIWGDVERYGGTKIAEHALDLVLVSNLLFQLPDKRAALEEARRVLKAGGRLVIIDWNDSYGGMGPPKEDVFSKERARKLAGDVGFEDGEEFHAGAHHYGLIFTRATRARPRHMGH